MTKIAVVCKASSENKAQKAIKHIVTVAATLPALIVSHPAFALVGWVLVATTAAAEVMPVQPSQEAAETSFLTGLS